MNDQQPPARRRSTALSCAIVMLMGIMFFAGLGQLNLINPDESRHALISREMIDSGNFITPSLYGEPYYDKPVFLNWLISGALSIFGELESAIRLPVAIAALATTLACSAILRIGTATNFIRASQLILIVLPTMPLFFVMGRVAITDILLTCTITLSLLAMSPVITTGVAANARVYLGWALMGFGMLIKGPVAVLLAGAIAGITSTRLWGLRKTLSLLKPFHGAVIVLGVAAPWYVAAWLRSPEYIETFLIRHNLERYAVAGAVTHQEAWWYYPLLLPAVLLPWSLLLPAAIRDRFAATERDRLDVFCGIWALTVILFFLPAKARLITYMLPAVPALAMILARYLERLGDGKVWFPTGVTRAILAWNLVLGALLISAMTWVATPPIWWWTGLVAPFGALAARNALAHDNAKSLLTACVASPLALLLLTIGPGAQYWNRVGSYRDVAEMIEQAIPESQALLSYGTNQNSISWYARRMVFREKEPKTVAARLEETTIAGVFAKTPRIENLKKIDALGEFKCVWRGYPDLELWLRSSLRAENGQAWTAFPGCNPSHS